MLLMKRTQSAQKWFQLQVYHSNQKLSVTLVICYVRVVFVIWQLRNFPGMLHDWCLLQLSTSHLTWAASSTFVPNWKRVHVFFLNCWCVVRLTIFCHALFEPRQVRLPVDTVRYCPGNCERMEPGILYFVWRVVVLWNAFRNFCGRWWTGLGETRTRCRWLALDEWNDNDEAETRCRGPQGQGLNMFWKHVSLFLSAALIQQLKLC